MSQPHQIAIVPVCVSLTETVQLADIMGRVPVREIGEVLASQWAAQQGWHSVSSGVYQRAISADVTLECRISADEQVTFRRATESVRIKSTEEASVRLKQQEKVQDTAEAYSLAVNELISQAVVRALPARIRELGMTAGESTIRQTALGQEIDTPVQIEIGW